MDERPDAAWYREAKFGIFLHWGPYSLRGIEASWPLQSYDPQHLPKDEYEALAAEFCPHRYDPAEWARAAKDAGARYVVLTTKHHDGYCLFQTATTSYNAAATGPQRDLVAPYVEAARAEGLRVGLYFTLIDWHDPDFATIPIAPHLRSPQPFQWDPVRWYAFYRRFVTQLEELLTNYGPIDILWFDVAGLSSDRWRSRELVTFVKGLQPSILINNRLPDAGDFATPEQFVPVNAPPGLWETNMTMNNQWGYHPDASQYKDVGELIRTLVTVVGKGGNFLLNVGPQPDGQWPAPARERLAEVGAWLRRNGPAIYGTSRGPHPACFGGPMTRKGRTLYLHLFDIPSYPLEVRGVHGPVRHASIVHSGQSVPFHYFGGVTRPDKLVLDVSPEWADKWDTVVAIEFEEPPEYVEP